MYTNNITFKGKSSLISKLSPKTARRRYTAHNGISPIYQPKDPNMVMKMVKWFKGVIQANKNYFSK